MEKYCSEVEEEKTEAAKATCCGCVCQECSTAVIADPFYGFIKQQDNLRHKERVINLHLNGSETGAYHMI